MPTERFLNGFVNDPHPTATEFANNLELPDALRERAILGQIIPGQLPTVRLELLHLNQGREEITNLGSQFRMPVAILGERRTFSASEAGDELLRKSI
jgi:hypothetical protein